MKASTRTGLRLVLLVVSSVLSLLLLEGAFRLCERLLLVHEIDPSASVYDLTRYEYNDHEGFLDRERAPGEFRILSFGDSFAESVTRPEYAYASVIQRNLSSGFGGRRVRVVNLGRNGTSFPDYAAQFRVWSRSVDFDAVLFNLYAGNDFFDMNGVVFVEAGEARYRSGTDAALRYGPGVDIPRRYPLRILDYAYALYYSRAYAAAGDERADLYRPGALQYPHDVYLDAQARQVSVYRPDLMPEYFDAYSWLFKLLLVAREIEESGAAVAITVAPPHFAVSEPWTKEVLSRAGVERGGVRLALPGRVVFELAREAGFRGPVIDLTPCLRAASAAGESLYYGTNTHWNLRGNEIVGNLLADALSRAWFDAGLYAYRDAPAGCLASVAPVGSPPADVRERLSEAKAVIRDLMHFEQTTLSALLGRTFGDRAELFEALERAGHRRDPARVRGAFWGFFGKETDPMIRPHGLRRFVRPYGWAIDLDAPGEPVFVAFLRRGRVIGVGRTRAAAAERSAWIPGVRADTPNVVFRSLIRRPTFRLRPGDDLQVVAISPGGRFAVLPFVADGPLSERGVGIESARGESAPISRR